MEDKAIIEIVLELKDLMIRRNRLCTTIILSEDENEINNLNPELEAVSNRIDEIQSILQIYGDRAVELFNKKEQEEWQKKN